jgi:hypothetical protein
MGLHSTAGDFNLPAAPAASRIVYLPGDVKNVLPIGYFVIAVRGVDDTFYLLGEGLIRRAQFTL